MEFVFLESIALESVLGGEILEVVGLTAAGLAGEVFGKVVGL